jgi:hypothetical protein
MENVRERVRNLPKSGLAFEQQAGASDQVEQQNIKKACLLRDFVHACDDIFELHFHYDIAVSRETTGELHSATSTARYLWNYPSASTP